MSESDRARNGSSSAPQARPDPYGAARGDGDIPPNSEMGMFFAFRYPGFRWLWIGNAFSSAAQWMHLTTLGWVVWDVTGSGVLLGAIIGVGNLMSPFVSPFGGLAADRFKRNHIIAATQLMLLLNALLLAVALTVDVVEVWMLFAFSMAASVFNGVNMPTRQAMVFDVVPRQVGPNAVALSNLAMNVMRTLGPVFAGGLIVVFSVADSLFVQSAVYFLVVLTMLRIPIAARPAGAAMLSTFLRDLFEGYRWVLTNRGGRILMLMMVIYPLFIIPVHTTIVVIFAEETFQAGAGGLGILHGALGAGGIIGGLLVAALNRVERRGMMQIYSMFVCGGFLAVFALVAGFTGAFWLGAAMLVLSGVGGAMYNTTNQTLVQLIAPDHLRGRITSVMQVQPLFMAIGIFVTGVAADAFGEVPAGAANGLLAFGMALLVLLLSPYMRQLRLSGLMSRR